MTIIVNFYGSPGTGKSTTAAELFVYLKKHYRHLQVELVREYAKELEYQLKLRNTPQDEIFEEQKRREDMLLLGTMDVIITDSPLFLSNYYSGNTIYPMEWYVERYSGIVDVFLLPNTDVFYQEYGRQQKAKDSLIMSADMLTSFKDLPNLLILSSHSDHSFNVIVRRVLKTIEQENGKKKGR